MAQVQIHTTFLYIGISVLLDFRRARARHAPDGRGFSGALLPRGRTCRRVRVRRGRRRGYRADQCTLRSGG